MTNEIPELKKVDPAPRLWPGVALLVFQWILWLALPIVAPGAAVYGLLIGVLGGGGAILLWWLFFSRLRWIERLAGLLLATAAPLAAHFVVHDSIAPWVLVLILFIPFGCLALVGWAAAVRYSPGMPRLTSLPAAALLACSMLAMLRLDGVTGEGHFHLRWRWTPTAEQRLLASTEGELRTASGTVLNIDAKFTWSEFRGQNRDGVVRGGVKLATDWSHSKPVELWRRPVGPGWSSFAVSGNLVFTQEQRGEDEIVACYQLTTGQPAWAHRDAARFWESVGGAGPRGTPTVSDGRVYTLGATGIVNVLNAADGKVVWSKNAATDTEVKVPEWGFAGSPLVVDDLVVIATGGRLVAYDRKTGDRKWIGPKGVGGYSSPHLATIGGVRQILLVKSMGVVSVVPQDGAELWKHTWKGDGIVQPGATTDGDVYLGSGSGLNPESGVLRLAVARGPEGWTVSERWNSRGLKPYYNDCVFHKGHAYGFDGGILGCIDLADGKRKWKGGRFGHGQVLLLADQDALLVLSEAGVVALVQAAPDAFRELARFKAIEGKTWNHPVLVEDVLLVRNGEEMAAFRLPQAKR
jgi:outer membrane protein assembly factor BamB